MKLTDAYLAEVDLCVDTDLTYFSGTNLLDLTYIKQVKSIKDSVRLVILKRREFDESYFRDLKTHEKYKFGIHDVEAGDKFVDTTTILPIKKAIGTSKDNLPKRKVLKMINNLNGNK